jgi:hypothetical protein
LVSAGAACMVQFHETRLQCPCLTALFLMHYLALRSICKTRNEHHFVDRAVVTVNTKRNYVLFSVSRK